MTDRNEAADYRVAIIFLRAIRGWDQGELAATAGMAPSTISRYESGESSPSAKTFERIVSAVGVPAATMRRLFAVIRSARAAVTGRTSRLSIEDMVEAAAAEFSDEMCEVFRDAAALVLQQVRAEDGEEDEDEDSWADDDLAPEEDAVNPRF
jgi:transcriptional regulator with XRE-family HTH domain